jgi:hypothetical protein
MKITLIPIIKLLIELVTNQSLVEKHVQNLCHQRDM